MQEDLLRYRPAICVWVFLFTFLLVGESYLALKGHPVLTDAWHLGLSIPKWRICLIAFWIFTSKHLFFRQFLPKVDPYWVVAYSVAKHNDKVSRRTKCLN